MPYPFQHPYPPGIYPHGIYPHIIYVNNESKKKNRSSNQSSNSELHNTIRAQPTVTKEPKEPKVPKVLPVKPVSDKRVLKNVVPIPKVLSVKPVSNKNEASLDDFEKFIRNLSKQKSKKSSPPISKSQNKQHTRAKTA